MKNEIIQNLKKHNIKSKEELTSVINSVLPEVKELDEHFYWRWLGQLRNFPTIMSPYHIKNHLNAVIGMIERL